MCEKKKMEGERTKYEQGVAEQGQPWVYRGSAALVVTVVAPEKILAVDTDVALEGCRGVHRPGMTGMAVVGNVVHY